jgi:predicted SAM-dependent methyltransferase
MIKLNLGCGDLLLPGYINIDLYDEHADVKMDITKLDYPDNYADEISTTHVIEHFDFRQAFDILREWHRVLKPGGFLVTECPDFLGSCKKFIASNEQERINMYGHLFAKAWLPGQTHKFMYTETQLKWTLAECGFENMTRIPALRYIGMEDVCLKIVCNKPVTTEVASA